HAFCRVGNARSIRQCQPVTEYSSIHFYWDLYTDGPEDRVARPGGHHPWLLHQTPSFRLCFRHTLVHRFVYLQNSTRSNDRTCRLVGKKRKNASYPENWVFPRGEALNTFYRTPHVSRYIHVGRTFLYRTRKTTDASSFRIVSPLSYKLSDRPRRGPWRRS